MVFEFQDHLRGIVKNPNKYPWRERFEVRKIAHEVERHSQALISALSKRSNSFEKKTIKGVGMRPIHFTAIELKHLLL